MCWSLGLKADQQYYVYDFWNQKLVGRFKGHETLAMPLKGNEALVCSVHERVRHPQIISTNRHIMQGMMELHDVTWDHAAKVHSGTADVVAGETIEIVFAANGHAKASVTVDHGQAEIATADHGLFVLKLDCNKTQQVQWQLGF